MSEEELGKFISFLLVGDRRAEGSFAEAYRMNRRISEDPMANYVDKEDL